MNGCEIRKRQNILLRDVRCCPRCHNLQRITGNDDAPGTCCTVFRAEHGKKVDRPVNPLTS